MELSDLFDSESLESVERKIDFERMVEGLKAREVWQALNIWIERNAREE